jgi:hypothetical protein
MTLFVLNLAMRPACFLGSASRLNIKYQKKESPIPGQGLNGALGQAFIFKR